MPFNVFELTDMMSATRKPMKKILELCLLPLTQRCAVPQCRACLSSSVSALVGDSHMQHPFHRKASSSLLVPSFLDT